jgi:hypothetical protein
MMTMKEYGLIIAALENLERDIALSNQSEEFKNGMHYAIDCVRRNIEHSITISLLETVKVENYGEDF